MTATAERVVYGDVHNPAGFARNCERCGAEFFVVENWRRERFCSRSCANSRQRRRVPESDRFWPKVNKDGPVPQIRPELGQCWVWTAYLNKSGYGQFGLADRSLMLAHRWAWEREHGPVPDGLELDHLCRVRACVRPSHLEAVTRSINAQRGLKGNLKPPTQMREKCKNGHLMTPENRYPRKDGRYEKYGCRQCARDSCRRYYGRSRGTA